MKKMMRPLAFLIAVLLLGIVAYMNNHHGLPESQSRCDGEKSTYTEPRNHDLPDPGRVESHSGQRSDRSQSPGKTGLAAGALPPSIAANRKFPALKSNVLASQLPADQFRIYQMMKAEFPQVDWTEDDPTYQAIVEKREQLPLDLDNDQREAHAAWLAAVEPVRQELVRLRAEAQGISPSGREDDRSYGITGFRSGMPVYMQTTNANAAITTGVSFVRWNPGLDPYLGNTINGSEVYMNVSEVEEVAEHTELQLPNGGGSRILYKETSNPDTHATHVTGTMGAWGYDPSLQGMAPRGWFRTRINLYNYHITADGMATPGQQTGQLNPRTGNPQLKSVVGNSSLGRNYTSTHYTSESASYDTALRDYPYFMHFTAAGNSGSGYETLTGAFKTGKNMIVIGSVSAATRNASGTLTSGGGISSFSSRGPTYDGRIKPDFVGLGDGVRSTTGTTGASYMSGTSMSTPNVTGSVALLMDYVRQRLPQQYLRHPTYKALLMSTTDDLGNPGPDYTYGWGLVNVHAAAKLIRQHAESSAKRLIIEDSLSPAQTWTETYVSDGSKPIRVSIAWLDPAASADYNRSPRLRNDLDVRIIGPGGTVYDPYVMPFTTGKDSTPAFDASLYNATAATGDNFTDPLEQVRIATPLAGAYVVQVTHKGTLWNNQAQLFSVAVNGLSKHADLPPVQSFSFTEAIPQDGKLNPGEEAVTTVTMINRFTNPFANVVAQLTTNDPDVTLLSDTVNYGTLTAGQTSIGDGTFRIRLAPGASPHTVALNLTITSSTDEPFVHPMTCVYVNSTAISGYVRSGLGNPIAGATVSWTGTRAGQVTTAADGFYAIPEVDGTYAVTASAPGFISSSPVSLTVPPSRTQDFALDSCDLTVTPNPLSLQAPAGQTASGTLNLANTGNLPVTWSIPASGYRFTTSDQPGGPAYVWNDISITGTRVTGMGDDTNLGPFPIGFSVPFYGQNFTSIRINSNGWLSFTSASSGIATSTTAALPSSSLPENLIAAMMRDLNPSSGGTVHYQQIDDETFVVQFTDIPRFDPVSASKKVTFQVVLKHDGTILLYYLRADDPEMGLVGIQNAAKNSGLTIAYNQAFLKPGLAVRIQNTPTWLSLTPASGTLAAGATADVTVSCASAGLAADTYPTYVIINSNDTDAPVRAVPLLFTVGTSAPQINAWPTASPLVYGQALSASTLSGGMASVPGTFAFDEPSATLAVGTHSVAVTFTPTDTATYTPVQGSVTVTIANATTGFSQTVAGTYDYNTGTNWAGGTINGIWDATTILAGTQTITFAADTALTTGLTFNYSGNYALTLQSASTTTKNLTLSGDIVLNTGSGTTANVTIGNSSNHLNVNLGGAIRAMDVAAKRTLTLVDVVSNGGLTKTGGGTLVLTGANTYSGGTSIGAGTVKAGNAKALGDSAGAVSVTSGAVLDLNGTTLTNTNALTLNGTGISSNGALINSSATAGTYAGLVTLGSASSIIAGAGNITLSNTGTIDGATFALTVGGTFNTTINSIIGTTTGTLTKKDAGTLTLTGVNTYTGATTISGGILRIGAGGTSGSVSSSSALAMGGALVVNNTSAGFAQPFASTTFNPGASTITATNGKINLQTITRNTGGTVDFASSGSVITSTSNDATGILGGYATFGGTTWAVANGAGAITGYASYTASLAGTTAPGTTANVDVLAGNTTPWSTQTLHSLRFNTAAATTLTLDSGQTLTDTSGGILVTPTVGGNASTITGGTLVGAGGGDLVVIQNNTGAGLTLSSVVADNTSATGLTKSGAGSLTLSGANTFTGGVIILNGSLVLGGTGALNSTAGSENSVAFGVGAPATTTLNLNGKTVTVANLTTHAMPGTPVVQNANATAATLTVGNSTNASGTFAGTIQNGTGGGALSLIKAGTGTLTLTGSNTYTGTTTISGGTLELGVGGSLSTGGIVNVGGSGTFSIGSSVSQSLANVTVANNQTGTMTGGGSLTFTGASFVIGSTSTSATTQTLDLSGLGNFTYNNSSGTFSVGGQSSSNNPASTGTLTLSANSTITASTFGVGNISNGGNTNQATNTNLGTLKLRGSTTINTGSISVGYGQANGVVQYASGTSNPTLKLRDVDGTNPVTTMTIGEGKGNGNIYTNSGSMNLVTGVTGTSTLDAAVGTLTIGYYNRTGTTNNAGTENGTFTMDAGTLTVSTMYLGRTNTAGGGSIVTGAFTSGAGGVIKVATLTLVDKNNTSGSANVSGTFNLNGGADLYATTIQPGGNGTAGGSATRKFNWTDGTIHNYNASTDLTVSAGPTWTLAATGTHAFHIDDGRTGTVAAALDGAGGTLTKAGAGLLTLSNTNTYSGATTVSGGTLALGASGSIATSVGLSLGAGAALDTTAQTSYAIPATMPVTLHLTGTGAGASATIKAAGLDISNAKLHLVIDSALDDSAYVLAEYTSLSGSAFASLTGNIPADYSLNYAYLGNKIALVKDVLSTPYEAWAGSGAFTTDSNNDGVPNGLAWLLGADTTTANATVLLPKTSQEGGQLVMTFDCLNTTARGPAILEVQYSIDLGVGDPWTNHEVVVPDADGTDPGTGIAFTVTPVSGTINHVKAVIPTAGNVFGRLSGTP